MAAMVMAMAKAWHLRLLQRGSIQDSERHLLSRQEYGRLHVCFGVAPGGIGDCFAHAVHAAAGGGGCGIIPCGGVPGGLGTRVAPVGFRGAQPGGAALAFLRCADGGAVGRIHMSPRVWLFVVSSPIDLFLSLECLYNFSHFFTFSVLVIILHVVGIAEY